MPNLVLVYDEKFQQHLTPESHPESPNRLAAIELALHRSDLFDQVKHAEARLAKPEDLTVVHDAAYIEELENKTKQARKDNSMLRTICVPTVPSKAMLRIKNRQGINRISAR